MKFNILSLALALVFFSTGLFAQTPETIVTESGEPIDQPLDDVTEKTLIYDHRVLPYDHVREADILMEKRLWRVIDVREKMNLPFAYPPRPFFTILMEGALNGEITVYSTEDDKFSAPLMQEEVASKVSRTDTIITFNPETYEEQVQVVRNDINPEDVKRFRIKEIWFFDEETSMMQVRILGIAPLIDVNDDSGNFLYESPMFWVYYPDAREILARERVFNVGNDASPISWEDIMEMRYFASYVYKESNVYDRRLQGYLAGVDLLLESNKIQEEIFNWERDLWSY